MPLMIKCKNKYFWGIQMQKFRLLLIEDEEDIAALIKLQAEMSGYKIVWEADGLNGYRAIEKEKPDLVILDIMLPGLNGLDICRKVKNHPELKGIPIILVSAKGEELDQVLGLELGADDYITKPFSQRCCFLKSKLSCDEGKKRKGLRL